jgi:hypothetical protein
MQARGTGNAQLGPEDPERVVTLATRESRRARLSRSHGEEMTSGPRAQRVDQVLVWAQATGRQASPTRH